MFVLKDTSTSLEGQTYVEHVEGFRVSRRDLGVIVHAEDARRGLEGESLDVVYSEYGIMITRIIIMVIVIIERIIVKVTTLTSRVNHTYCT